MKIETTITSGKITEGEEFTSPRQQMAQHFQKAWKEMPFSIAEGENLYAARLAALKTRVIHYVDYSAKYKLQVEEVVVDENEKAIWVDNIMRDLLADKMNLNMFIKGMTILGRKVTVITEPE